MTALRRGTQIPGARASNFVRWRLIFVGHQYGNCLLHSAGAYNFEGGSLNFLENVFTPAAPSYPECE